MLPWPGGAAAAERKIYAAVFEVTLGEGGAVSELKLDHVTDADARTVKMALPPAYLDAARDQMQAVFRGRKPGHFFTYLLFDPRRPNDAGFGREEAPPADPARTISLTPGESVTFRIRPDGRLELVERAAIAEAPASQFEDMMVSAMASGLMEGKKKGKLPPSALKHLPERPTPPAGAIRLSMKRAGEKSTVLVVENGAEGMLYYRAWMSAGGREAATSVCDVAAQIPSFEHWPHRIERLDLAGFGFRAGERLERECR